jgi:hypothetical protein
MIKYISIVFILFSSKYVSSQDVFYRTFESENYIKSLDLILNFDTTKTYLINRNTIYQFENVDTNILIIRWIFFEKSKDGAKFKTIFKKDTFNLRRIIVNDSIFSLVYYINNFDSITFFTKTIMGIPYNSRFVYQDLILKPSNKNIFFYLPEPIKKMPDFNKKNYSLKKLYNYLFKTLEQEKSFSRYIINEGIGFYRLGLFDMNKTLIKVTKKDIFVKYFNYSFIKLKKENFYKVFYEALDISSGAGL